MFIFHCSLLSFNILCDTWLQDFSEFTSLPHSPTGTNAYHVARQRFHKKTPTKNKQCPTPLTPTHNFTCKTFSHPFEKNTPLYSRNYPVIVEYFSHREWEIVLERLVGLSVQNTRHENGKIIQKLHQLFEFNLNISRIFHKCNREHVHYTRPLCQIIDHECVN